jgi:hypothetical protein
MTTNSEAVAKPGFMSRLFDILKGLDEAILLSENEVLFRRVAVLERKVTELNANRKALSTDPHSVADGT